ncbi:MAG: hypothetical protein M3247_06190 [Thermoproteota archaeon]|nr:hypothetical protein [Thermoproteota archaeon]
MKCAECRCAPKECGDVNASQRCQNCTKETCCCAVIHHGYATNMRISLMTSDDCCSKGVCNNDISKNAKAKLRTKNKKSIYKFFGHVKSLYAAALGIEILCIAAAEIGENTALFIVGFNHLGILIAYTMGYCLATFTTFVTILGRYRYATEDRIDSCCSVLEQDTSKDFLPNVVTTFKNFGLGLRKLEELPKQPNLRAILKTSLIILVTAETACIITAETVDLIFYKQAFYLSIPLALLSGAFTVVAPQAYKKMKQTKGALNST